MSSSFTKHPKNTQHSFCLSDFDFLSDSNLPEYFFIGTDVVEMMMRKMEKKRWESWKNET